MPPLLALALASVPYVLVSSFSDLYPWDDDGFMMIIFRQLRNGGAPYTEVHSLYGPFYLLSFHALFGWLRLPLTHDVVRLVSAAAWLSYAVLFCLVLLRMTGSRLCAGTGFLMALFVAREAVSSPLHPILLGLILIALLFLAVDRCETRPSPGLLVAIGALLVAIGLIKINLGIIVGGATGVVLLRALPASRGLRVPQTVSMVALVLLPVPLMWPLFDLGWPIFYAISACCVLAAAMRAWGRMPIDLRIGYADLKWPVAGGLLVFALSTGLMLAEGARPGDIFHAILIYPTEWIREWYFLAPTHLLVFLAHPASLAYAAIHFSLGARWVAHPVGRLVTLSVKGAVGISGLGLAAFAALNPDQMGHGIAYMYVGLSVIWLLGAPVGPAPERGTALRAMLLLVGGMFYLYPFPVAGGQLSTAAMFTGLAASVLLHDVWRESLAVRAFGAGRLGDVARAGAWLALAAVLFAATEVHWSRYQARTNAGLPGTRYVRAEATVVDTYHWLVRELATCPAIFSFPGLPSLYFWTGREPIDGATVNNYLALLSNREQAALAARIDHVPDVCVVFSESLNLRLWDRGQMERNPPLLRYLRDGFQPVREHGGFQILRR